MVTMKLEVFADPDSAAKAAAATVAARFIEENFAAQLVPWEPAADTPLKIVR